MATWEDDGEVAAGFYSENAQNRRRRSFYQCTHGSGGAVLAFTAERCMVGGGGGEGGEGFRGEGIRANLQACQRRT